MFWADQPPNPRPRSPIDLRLGAPQRPPRPGPVFRFAGVGPPGRSPGLRPSPRPVPAAPTATLVAIDVARPARLARVRQPLRPDRRLPPPRRLPPSPPAPSMPGPTTSRSPPRSRLAPARRPPLGRPPAARGPAPARHRPGAGPSLPNWHSLDRSTPVPCPPRSVRPAAAPLDCCATLEPAKVPRRSPSSSPPRRRLKSPRPTTVATDEMKQMPLTLPTRPKVPLSTPSSTTSPERPRTTPRFNLHADASRSRASSPCPPGGRLGSRSSKGRRGLRPKCPSGPPWGFLEALDRPKAGIKTLLIAADADLTLPFERRPGRLVLDHPGRKRADSAEDPVPARPDHGPRRRLSRSPG